MRCVIKVDVEVSHDFPFHEDVCKVNSIEQSACTLECIMLGALNINFHYSLTERRNSDKVIKHNGVDNDWTSSSAVLYLQHKHSYSYAVSLTTSVLHKPPP